MVIVSLRIIRSLKADALQTLLCTKQGERADLFMTCFLVLEQLSSQAVCDLLSALLRTRIIMLLQPPCLLG